MVLQQSEEDRIQVPLGLQVDPLNISAFIPNGLLHVDKTGSYYAADLWMWNITLHGLTQAYLQEVEQ